MLPVIAVLWMYIDCLALCVCSGLFPGGMKLYVCYNCYSCLENILDKGTKKELFLDFLVFSNELI